ncbi:MAG: hypothetical protein R2715_23560 [Ilumatobacteraceae bacterium]
MLKEIGEAPESFRKTLRGKIIEQDGLRKVFLGGTFTPAILSA